MRQTDLRKSRCFEGLLNLKCYQHTDLNVRFCRPSISTKNSKRKKSSLLSSTNSEGESDDSNEYFEEKNESIAASKSRSPSQHILLTPQVSDTPVCGVREPQMSETKVPTLVDLSPEFQRMMVGRLHGDIPTNCKQIQVFHCAPSDGKLSRSYTNTIYQNLVMNILYYRI